MKDLCKRWRVDQILCRNPKCIILKREEIELWCRRGWGNFYKKAMNLLDDNVMGLKKESIEVLEV